MKIRKLMKDLFILLFFVVTTVGCAKKNNINCDIDMDKSIQIFKSDQLNATLISVNNGSFGVHYQLKICSQNLVVEDISIRGDENVPKIDSIMGYNIYLSYSFPNLKTNEELGLEGILLGDALLNREQLKFNYHFTNKIRY